MGHSSVTVVNGGNIFADYRYGTEIFYPWVLTNFQITGGASSSHATLRFQSYPEYVRYEGFSPQTVRLNGDGYGGLKVTVLQNGQVVDRYTITDFSSGRIIDGFGASRAGETLAFGEVGDNQTFTVDSITPSRGAVSFAITSNGSFSSLPTNRYTYYFRGIDFGDFRLDLRGGVTILGDDSSETLRGFDYDPFTGGYFNDTLLGGGGNDTSTAASVSTAWTAAT